MALTRLSRSSSPIDPLPQLGRVISELLPHQGLPLIDKVRRWSDRMLVLGALLLSLVMGVGFLAARHAHALEAMQEARDQEVLARALAEAAEIQAKNALRQQGKKE